MKKSEIYKWACIINGCAIIAMLGRTVYDTFIYNNGESVTNMEVFMMVNLPVGIIYLIIDGLGLYMVKKIHNGEILSEKMKKNISVFHIIESVMIIPSPILLFLCLGMIRTGDYNVKLLMMGEFALVFITSICQLALTRKMVKLTEENHLALSLFEQHN